MYDDNFFETLPDDPVLAGHKICDEFFSSFQGFTTEKTIVAEKYNEVLEGLGILEAYCESYGLDYALPKASTNKELTVTNTFDFFRKLSAKLEQDISRITIEKSRNKYLVKFGKTFTYTFSDGDLARVQTLINELREKINECDLFDASHKQRILKKLESLQYELHKKITNVDKLWGLVGEAGVVLGKFGQDAKPLVDRIKEIAQITWRTQARSEELPSNTPLPHLESDEPVEIE